MNVSVQQHETVSFNALKWNLRFEYPRMTEDALLVVFQQGEQPVMVVRQDGDLLTAEVYFDGQEVPIVLRGELPDAEIVYVRIANTENRIALYLNQKLCDEDWPLGSVLLSDSVCIRAVAPVTLDDDLSAEAGNVPEQNLPPIRNIQNWKPDGLNTGVGDCMPFSHDGVYHLFYLFDRRGHGSKYGLGAHQWAHLSTTDLLTWRQHPMAIGIDEQYEGSICTGSLIFHGGLYYAYYAVRMSDRTPARLSWAVSRDGVHFQKTQQVFTLTAPYEPVSARDPFVFRDADGLFHLLVTTSLIDPDGTKRGCLAHLISGDLQTWEQQAPFLLLEIEDQPECADYFQFNGWYYLIFSNYGMAHYRMSRSPFGPWSQPEKDVLGYKECRVPRTAIFNGDRIIVAGFVVPPQARYAGDLIVYEALQNADGTLSFVTPKELDAPRTVLT